ncbi:DUF2141 domain-containing protein [Acidisphaera sp. L21]|uniref:DUF2141 domain-containing protein n=1 Tax=Acidisphaera sp. L21 TaxID=1641851 RepID=UPI0020B11F40|nr:DUF2141 domain-containing protein [Acidisphaera sp. L21]
MKARIVVALLLSVATARAEPGVVEVTVTGVHSATGEVLVAICDRATFLQETCRYHARARANPGSVTIRISGVPPGTYAAQAFQDENGNDKIDRSFLGMPKEGIGFSNDAKMRFGPPSFDDAAFQLGPTGGVIHFALRYFN